MNLIDKKSLIDFERKVADTFNDAKIKAPIHLHGNNETQLIEIFKGIMPFLGIVILAMFLMYIFPGIALWLPETLFAQ